MKTRDQDLHEITGQEIGRRVDDAYMTDAYGETEWAACATELLSRGLNVREVEAFLRSKHMRWSGDLSEGEHTAKALRRYLAKNFAPSGLKSEARELVRMTF